MVKKLSKETKKELTKTKKDLTKKIEQKKIESKDNPEIILTDFYADWCVPCDMQNSIIEELKKKYSEKVKFEKLDIDKNEQFANKFKILAIPTIIIQKNVKVVNRFVGVTSKKILENELNNLLNNIY